MATKASCPECGCVHSVEERLIGRTIKCKECAEPFRVEADASPKASAKASAKEKQRAPEREAIQESARPAPPRSRREDPDRDDPPVRRRRAAADDDFEDDPPRRRRQRDDDQHSNLPLILGLVGGGVVVLLLVGGLLWWLMARSGQADIAIVNQGGPPQFNPNPPVNNQVPNNQVPNNQNNNPPPGVQQPNVDPNPVDPPKKRTKKPKNDPGDQPKFEQPKGEQPKGEQPKFEAPPLKQGEIENAGPIGEWKAAPDPGIDVSAAPANPKWLQNLIGSPVYAIASTPSPFVAVRHGPPGKEGWQVFDVQQGKSVGIIKGKPDFSNEVLSPDGKLIAGRGKGPKFSTTAILVWSVPAQKWATTFVVDGPFFKYHDFLEDNHVLTAQNAGLDTKYEIWNSAGKPVQQVQRKGWPNFKGDFAISPGRKYVALVDGSRGRGAAIVLMRPVKGEVVGELPLPKEIGMQVKALAFSPDGTELACYTEAFGKARLISWTLAKGEVAIDHSFVQTVAQLAPKGDNYAGRVMEWVPDKSGWLFYGQVWIDYASGAPIHTLAPPAGATNYQRWFIGKDHVALTGGTAASQQVRLEALPAAEIAAKTKEARAGGGPAPVALPEPKAADVANAKNLGVPGGAVAWAVEADAAPAGKNFAPLNLRTSAADSAQALFAPSGHAVILASVAPNPLAKQRNIRADRYDLTANKFLSDAVLFPAELGQQRVVLPGHVPPVNAVAELSTDGNLLAVRVNKDDPRLDVWNVAEGKHQVGWIPYDNGKVEWFRFIDANRLLTLSNNGRLASWTLPECKAVYIGDGYRAFAEVSATRKYVAILGPSALEILETDSGARKGVLALPDGGINTCPGIAFSRDGKSLAAVFFSPKGMQLGRWNLSTGALEATMIAPVATGPLQWCSPKQVLANNTLFDFDFKNAPIAMYNLPAHGKAATGSPDGRFWFTTEGAQKKAFLTSVALPEAQAADISAQAAAGKIENLIPPGSTVNVLITTNSERFRQAVDQSLKNRLQQMGFKLGGGGVTLSINTQVSETGKELEYVLRKGFGPPLPFMPGGPGGGQVVKVRESQVACQAIIVDQKNTTLHKAEQIIAMPYSIRFQGDNIQQELIEAMWNNAINWGNNAPLPTNVYRINGQVQALPKIVNLTAGG